MKTRIVFMSLVVILVVLTFVNDSGLLAGPPGQQRGVTGPPVQKGDVRQRVSPQEREAIGLDEPSWTTEHGKLHPDVQATLEKDERPWPRRVGFEGSVYVDVYLRHEQRGERTSEQNKAAIKEVQRRVLSRLTAAEFSVEYQLKTSAGLVGYVSSAGLVKLKKDSDVIAVGLDDKPITKAPPHAIGKRPGPGEKPGWTLADGKIEPQVYAALEKSANAYVYVIVSLNRGVPREAAFNEKKAAARKAQQRVLSGLSADEFRVRSRSMAGGFSGYAKAEALPKLEAHPDVVVIRLTKRFKRSGSGVHRKP